MRLLSVLPNTLLEEILLQWLDTVDLARFDRSICHHQARLQYLSLINQSFLSTKGLSLDFVGWDRYIQWINQRRLSTKRLSLDNLFLIVTSENFSKLFCGLREFHLEWGDLALLQKYLSENLVNTNRIQRLELPFLTSINLLKHCFRLSCLEELNLQRCLDPLLSDFSSTLVQLSQLRKLSLCDCAIISSLLKDLPRYCKQLQVLNLERATITFEYSFEDSPFHHWIELQKQARELQSEVIFPNLISLNVKNVFPLNADIVSAFILHFPTVEHWFIGSYFSRATIQTMVQSLNRLSSLDISTCPSNEFYQVITQFHVLFQTFPALLHLNLSYGYTLSDIHIISIAECCPELKTLLLNYCSRVTDRGILALAKCCRNLMDLSLSYCDLVTDFGLIALAENCTSLNSIILTSLLLLTDVGMIRLAECQPNLRTLGLSNCRGMTEAGLFGILASCTLLQQLDISDNDWKSDEIVVEILHRLNHLRKLYVGNGPEVSFEIFQSAARKASLQIIYDDLHD